MFREEQCFVLDVKTDASEVRSSAAWSAERRSGGGPDGWDLGWRSLPSVSEFRF